MVSANSPSTHISSHVFPLPTSHRSTSPITGTIPRKSSRRSPRRLERLDLQVRCSVMTRIVDIIYQLTGKPIPVGLQLFPLLPKPRCETFCNSIYYNLNYWKPEVEGKENFITERRHVKTLVSLVKIWPYTSQRNRVVRRFYTYFSGTCTPQRSKILDVWCPIQKRQFSLINLPY